MDKPTETLELVNSHLQRKDSLVCLHVSKRWNEIVVSILYEELDFLSLDKFNQAKSFFDNDEHLANTVKRLNLQSFYVEPLTTFSNLRELEYNSNPRSMHDTTKVMVNNFIDNLRNMPLLQVVSLNYGDIGIEELENIHVGAPNLQEFKMHRLLLTNDFWPEEENNLDSISPAGKLQALSFSFDLDEFVDDPHFLEEG